MFRILQEIYERRNLIRELVVKDLKVRYCLPLLGFLWAFLLPFFTVVVYYIVFSLILKSRISEAPFFLYLMSAVFPWGFFQGSLMASTSSLVDARGLVKEAGFPQYLVPFSIVLANAVNFLPSLAVIISACLLTGKLSLFIFLLPFVFFLHLALTLGLSVLFSVFYVKWRDLKYILDVVLFFLFNLTPVFYSILLVKDSFPPFWQKLYFYNPFVCLLNLYRIAFFSGFAGYLKDNIGLRHIVIIPVIFAASVLALGFYVYKRNKNTINDYLSY